MKFGITVNIGNYNSLRCESSEHDKIYECYSEVLAIVLAWDTEFDSMKWWIDKLKQKIIKERGRIN